MNRLTMDMATIDLYLFMKISGSIMIVFQKLRRILSFEIVSNESVYS